MIKNRSLNNLRVLNTRPLEQAEALSQCIQEAGGVVLSCPALEIQAASEEWLTSLPDLKTISSAIFISANAVHHSLPLIKKHLAWPCSILTIAIGSGTAHTLHAYGVEVNIIPERPNSEQVLTLPALEQIQHKRILLFKGEGGRTVIEDGLRRREADLFIFPVYRRVLPRLNPVLIKQYWQNDAVDIILATSQQALENVFLLFGQEAHNWLRSKPWMVVSERLASEAKRLGIRTTYCCEPHHIFEALQSFKQGF